ncbi:MAG: sodium:proton antiporter [Deltaproteobacteria bacterium]|nr:sodium:proton antiporter [Deltaproteobacteria bacterium]
MSALSVAGCIASSVPDGLGAQLSPLWVLPFAGLLMAIALLPLLVPHFWERNRNKALVAAVFALPIAVLLLRALPAALLHTAAEYGAFIILLGSLFVISGGICLHGDIRATPRNNTLFLAVGSLLANLIGTTGAAMLLIRPLLRTNSERQRTRHLPVFFIFSVANIGGLLTPLGDPPLFLGYLRGVPFFWTLRLLPIWLVSVASVLAIFYLVDRRAYRSESPEQLALDDTRIEPLRLTGAVNFVLLIGIVAAVLWLPGALRPTGYGLPWREAAMVALAAISYLVMPRQPRRDNRFSFGPIIEVAALFAGIFVTMVPALVILGARGGELPLREPWHYFWLTGVLSSFLDNAPTYLTFASMGCGYLGADAENLGSLLGVAAAAGRPAGEQLLAAISTGAVFMGANTYIGNGPNFMVKAISEDAGVKMPSFFGYMTWSGAILMPTFALVTVIFF